MRIPPVYSVTPEMLELISKIEALKLYFSSLTLSPRIKLKIQRANLLKSSLFSARIEGNPLLLSDIEKTEDKNKKEPFLPPRQGEILNLIKEHNILSFDMLRRRFLKVPERTLRYDLKKLVDNGLIETAGETRGRVYRAKE